MHTEILTSTFSSKASYCNSDFTLLKEGKLRKVIRTCSSGGSVTNTAEESEGYYGNRKMRTGTKLLFSRTCIQFLIFLAIIRQNKF